MQTHSRSFAVGAMVALWTASCVATQLHDSFRAGLGDVLEGAVALLGALFAFVVTGRIRVWIPWCCAIAGFTCLAGIAARGGPESSMGLTVSAMCVLGAFCGALGILVRISMRAAYDVSSSRDVAPVSEEAPLLVPGLLEHFPEALTILEADLTIGYLSPSVLEVFGRDRNDLIGQHLDQMTGLISRPLHGALRRAATQKGRPSRVEWEILDGKGRHRFVESTIATLREDAEPPRYVMTTRDVTDRVALDEQLREQAFHDTSTGLTHKALLADRATRALARLVERPGAVGLLLADLDSFSALNESLGRDACDYLLRVIARRLAAMEGPTCTVSRSGGAEFAVLLEEGPEAGSLVDSAERLCARIREPIRYGAREYRLTASVGFSEVGTGCTWDALVADAGAALYAAKTSGGNTTRQFLPSMRSEARIDAKRELESAVARSEFELFFQPAFDVATGRICSLEALLRWHRPGFGLLGPDQFLPLAIEEGMLGAIGRWALQSALQQLRIFESASQDGELSVSVNISAHQLAEGRIVEDVREALHSSGVAPRRLTLEISEMALSDGQAEIVHQLARLHALGVRLAIDDFGMGYTTLEFLRGLSVDIVKIHRSFIQSCGEERGRGLLEAVLQLGKSLSVLTVGEGAEEPGQLAVLCELGCDLVQGFLLSHPLSAAEVVLLVGQPSKDNASVSPFLSRWLQRHVAAETLPLLS